MKDGEIYRFLKKRLKVHVGQEKFEQEDGDDPDTDCLFSYAGLSVKWNLVIYISD